MYAPALCARESLGAGALAVVLEELDMRREPVLAAGGGRDGRATRGGGPIEVLLAAARLGLAFAARFGVVVRDMLLTELALEPTPNCFVGD